MRPAPHDQDGLSADSVVAERCLSQPTLSSELAYTLLSSGEPRCELMGVGEGIHDHHQQRSMVLLAAIYKNNDFEGFTLMGGFFDPKNTNRFGWDKEGDAGGASAGIYNMQRQFGHVYSQLPG